MSSPENNAVVELSHTLRVGQLGLFVLLASLLAATEARPVEIPASATEKSRSRHAAEIHPDLLLVGYRKGVSRQQRVAAHAAAGVELVHSYRRIPVDVVCLRAGAARDAVMAAYRKRVGIRYVEPNYRLEKTRLPNDPRFGELWGLHNTGQNGGTPGADIRVTNVWATLGTGSTGVLVAVIDTGMDYTHEDLVANVWTNPDEIANGVDDDGNGIVDDLHGARWVNGNGTPTSGDPMDGDGHGTHVSGTIGAVGHNGVGVAGVNWRVRLMALKFLDDEGGGWTADAISAIEYAIDKGAHLSNNSWGGGGYSQALKDAIDAAGAANQLFVAAAGNSASDNDIIPSYPASYDSPNLVAVASSDRFDRRSSFSCFGRVSVDLAAPGSSILSTIPGDGYDVYSGTSMAAPHVSGAAALLWSLHPGAAYSQIKTWLMQGTTRLAAWSGLTVTGGRLNVTEGARLAALPPEVTALDNLLAVSGEGDTSVFVTWVNPSVGSFDHVIIRRGTNEYPADWSDGEGIYAGHGQQVEDGPLEVGTVCYYGAWAVFTNEGGPHYSAAQYARCRVGGEPDDYFTEIFSTFDNDLDYLTVTFVPDGSVNGYRAFTDPAVGFPTDPAGGTVLTLGDDSFAQIMLAGGEAVRLYGTAYSSFFVGANGYLTFGEGDTAWSESLAAHFRSPRISCLFDDLNPASGGTVSWRQLPDRAAVTWLLVPEYGTVNQNSFQVEMFFDGTIRLTWLDVAARDGLAGLSAGKGLPYGFVESDLSNYPPRDDLRIAPRTLFESAGFVGGPFTPATNRYGLTNTGAQPLQWSASVTSSWLHLDASGGLLEAGGTTTVAVSIGQEATNLAHGCYESRIHFVNETSGRAQPLGVALTIAREGMTAVFYADYFVGPNPVVPALRNLGYSVTRASSWSAFNQHLETGSCVLAVGLNQAGTLNADPGIMAGYLAGGGQVVLADWTRNGTFGALFEAQYTGANDQTPVYLTDDDLVRGISNPLPLQDPGWGSFWSLGLRPLGGGESLGHFPNLDSALVWGNHGQTALLGFMADTVNAPDGIRFFENLFTLLETGGDPLKVRPAGKWTTSGYEGGPFQPTSQVYTLTNAGATELTWTASVSSNWLALDVPGGSLEPAWSTELTVSLTAEADALPPGRYNARLVVSNVTSGHRLERELALKVIPRPGEIQVYDSIAPNQDLSMPFGEWIVGQSRREQLTIHNADPTYNLIITGVAVLPEGVGGSSGDMAKAALLSATPVRYVPPAGRGPAWQPEKESSRVEYAPDQLLVGFAPGLDASLRESVHAAVGAQRLHRFRRIPVEVVALPKGSELKAAIQAYRVQPGVAYAEPNYRVRALREPDDPRFGEMWALLNTGQTGGTPGADIRAAQAWDITTGQTAIIVAVIDTGIDYTHPDLAGNMWINPAETANGQDDDGNGIVDDLHGARWTGGSGQPTSGDPMDGHRHGTHVAGTIGAEGDNGLGVVGVTWRVRLMALKFLDDTGAGWTADAISAIEYAIDKGAHLSNNSWGGGGYSQALKDIIDAAGEADQLFIAAAGNDGTDNDLQPHYPSSYTNGNIVAVASSDHHDARSSFSCFGRTSVDLAAPGSSILSTLPGGSYGLLSGTSMATPHVAGALALMRAINPGAPYAWLKQALLGSVDVLPAWTDRTVSGGRLNTAAALQALNPHFQLERVGTLPLIIPPGGSHELDVIYRPLDAGEHRGLVRIMSNDTNTPTVDVALSGSAVPDVLILTPGDSFVSEGPPGGPFEPASKTYTLTQTGTVTIPWTARVTEDWPAVSSSGGELTPGGTTNIEVSLTALAETLEKGVHQAALVVSNVASGVVMIRPIRLTVEPRLCEAVDACAWTWTTGGEARWFSQTNLTFDGEDAAQSGAVSDDQETWIQLEVEGPGRLSFWWKVSSETNWDFLRCYVDGELQHEISGETDWLQLTCALATGPHVVRWSYEKDASIADGRDAGWLDQVTFVAIPYEDASDHAGNYTIDPPTFVHGANGGTGFEPWRIHLESGATAVLDNSTNGTGHINSNNDLAFRFYGGPGNTYVNAIRPFALPLRSGDVFRVTIAYNWNGGARGICILAADSSELMNVNFGGGDTLSFKWGNWSTSTVLSTYWSPTTILQVAVTQLGDNQLRADLTRSDGYATNFVSTGLWAPAGQIKFYNGGHPADDVRYALYANDLIIRRLGGVTDGIPNWWWERYGIAGPQRMAQADGDGDGFTYWDEYIADTDPTNPDSYFSRAALAEPGGDMMMLVVDPSSTARWYRVEAATNLITQDWVLVPPEKIGTGAAVYFLVTNEASRRLYRTGVRLP